MMMMMMISAYDYSIALHNYGFILYCSIVGPIVCMMMMMTMMK